jgi:hypothetical protein
VSEKIQKKFTYSAFSKSNAAKLFAVSTERFLHLADDADQTEYHHNEKNGHFGVCFCTTKLGMIIALQKKQNN